MRARAHAVGIALALLAQPVAGAAQTEPADGAARTGTTTPDRQAPAAASPEAYYRFLLGRHLESRGDVEAAMQAYRAAASSAPQSAEIRAEIAGLLARLGRLDDAITEARAALAVDGTNREAHRVLGTLLSAAVDAGTPRVEREDRLREAITHLEQARRDDGVNADPSVELALGRLYIGTGEPDKAVELLQQLAEDYPTTTEAWALLSEAHAAAGSPEGAIRALDQGANFDPRLLFGLAELYEREERWLDAARTYERAAAFGPASRELRGKWAGALLNAPGDDSARRARELLEGIVAGAPDDDRAFYMLSQAHRRLEAWDAAESAARRVIALKPQSLWGPYALAQIFEERREYARVVETLAPVLEKWTPSRTSPKALGLTLLTHLGFAQMQLGRHDDAIATFQRARGVADDPSSFAAYLGQAYVVARRYDEALEVLEPLRAQQPGNERVAQLTVRAMAGAGRTGDAVDLLRAAIADEPSPDRYLLLSQVLSDARRKDEAQEVLEEASGRFPSDVSIPFQRGALYEDAGETDRAEAAFREVLKRDPRHAPALNYLGYMWAERGIRLEEALSLIERALAIDPGNGAYLDSLGWAYYQLKQFDRAHFHLARAAEQLPSNSVVQDHLGDALAALGRRQEAIAAWTRALAGDRESIEVAAIEGKIRRARSQAER